MLSSNIVVLNDLEGRDSGAWSLKSARNSHGFSVLEAAKALRVSPSTYERMEQGKIVSPGEDFVETRFSVFEAHSSNNNVVHGGIPIRLARNILGFSKKQMADFLNCPLGTYNKFESNGRVMSREKRLLIENAIKKTLNEICEI